MTDEAMSPLRRRMIEDMTIRRLAPKTQHDYVQRVKDFATFLGRSPDTAKSEDVRSFRLHLASSGAGAQKINATVSALRFFFNVTLDRPDSWGPSLPSEMELRGHLRASSWSSATYARDADHPAPAPAPRKGFLSQVFP